MSSQLLVFIVFTLLVYTHAYNSMLKGNIIIGPNTKGPAGPPAGLYDWIHCQRKEYKKFQADEKALMYDKWVKKLNEIGFDWAPMKSDGFSKMLMERKNQKYNDLWQKHFT